MTRRAVLVLLGCSLAQGARSEDARDQEIFGTPAPAAAAPTPGTAAPDKAAETAAQRLADTLQVGGRLEIRADAGQQEMSTLPGAGFGQMKQADVYFDTRPSKDLRGFLRARFTDGSGIDGQQASTSPACTSACFRTDIDEMWLKWGMQDTVYATLGKQHLKWGSGRFWNPTDFTATQVRDPLALFDRRLGTEMLKLNLPVEKGGHNYYAVLEYGDAAQIDQVSGALRAEYAFGGVGEAALSFQTRAHAPIRVGFDVSSGLGPIDVHSETAATKRESQILYSGTLDPVTGQRPVGQVNADKWFVQSVAGIEHSWKYNADNSVTVGAEFFYNQLGYDDRNLELYSLVMGQAQPLYAGQRYGGAYINLPTPGSWTETSFFLDGLRNLGDQTSVVRLSGTWLLYKDAEIQGFLSECMGDYGELCFRVPVSDRALAASPGLTTVQQQTIASLPTKRTLTTAGLGVVLKF